MTKIEPCEVFEFLSPDTVAETMNGIDDVPGLYKALWSLTKFSKPIPNIEDSGPMDHVGHDNLAALWNHLSPEHQEALNKIAEQEEAL